MKSDQIIRLRLQAHNIIMLFLMEQGYSREAASRSAFEQVQSASINLLKKTLASYPPDKREVI
jgi:acetoin utilization deacetylase AcuC-like enzyme